MDLFRRQNEAGDRARDAGIGRVMEGSESWEVKALEFLEKAVPIGTQGPMQMLAKMMSDAGLPRPRHQNVWGAFARTAQRKKLIQPTGRYTKTVGSVSRSRMSAEYRRI